MNGYFETVITATEYSYQEPVHYPTLQHYLVIRENLIGVYPVADLAEVTSNAILPANIAIHPAVQELRRLAALLIALCNDIFSLRNDYEEKEAMNAVLIAQHEQDSSLEEAYEMITKLHNELLEQFLQLRNRLPDLRPYNGHVQRYIANLEQIIHGHLLWYQYTKRY